MKMQNPFSDTVQAIGHDPETNELHVVWQKNGKHSVYKDVPADKADMVMKSASVGSALYEHIKRGGHEHSYLDD